MQDDICTSCGTKEGSYLILWSPVLDLEPHFDIAREVAYGKRNSHIAMEQLSTLAIFFPQCVLALLQSRLPIDGQYSSMKANGKAKGASEWPNGADWVPNLILEWDETKGVPSSAWIAIWRCIISSNNDMSLHYCMHESCSESTSIVRNMWCKFWAKLSYTIALPCGTTTLLFMPVK